VQYGAQYHTLGVESYQQWRLNKLELSSTKKPISHMH